MKYIRIRFRSAFSKDKGHCNLPLPEWSEREVEELKQKLISKGYLIIQESIEEDSLVVY